MNERPVVPAVSPAEAEEFWASGAEAYPSAPGNGEPKPETIQHFSVKDRPAMSRGFEIHPHEGGGWKLVLFEGDVESGCGFFPEDEYSEALEEGESWKSADAKVEASDSSCVGVDLPGVGHVHSADCPHKGSPVRSGRGPIVNDVPQLVRDFVDGGLQIERKRNKLFGQLLFAARELAESRIFVATIPMQTEVLRVPSWCMECQKNHIDGAIEHAVTCKTGRVLAIVRGLLATVDEVRPRGLSERVCLKCGARDDKWLAVERHEAEVYVEGLGLNQCVGAGISGKGHTLYTHLCESRHANHVAQEGGAA